MKKKVIEKTELEKRLEKESEGKRAKMESHEDTASAAEGAAAEETLAAVRQERDALKDQLLRARAEFDNYRKRIAREQEANRKKAAQALLADLLPVVDNLERAVDHGDDASGGLAAGVAMVLNQLGEVLGRHGLEPIPSVGEPFDPNVHEAIMSVEAADRPENQVAEEFLKGYRLGDWVLRPSKVSVSRGPATLGEENGPAGKDQAEKGKNEGKNEDAKGMAAG